MTNDQVEFGVLSGKIFHVRDEYYRLQQPTNLRKESREGKKLSEHTLLYHKLIN